MTFSNSDQDPADDGIRDGLRELAIPATPVNAASRVRDRLRRRRFVTTMLAITPVFVITCGLLLWRPWVANEHSPLTPPELAQSKTKPLEHNELLELFAAPPVDSLAIMASRDRASVAALDGLEGKE
jgi:hypothetical protein